MAGIKLKKSERKSGGGGRRGLNMGRGLRSAKMPEKRSINLIQEDKNKLSPVTAIPGVIIVLILAALFSKFLVVDRLVAMSNAQAKVGELTAERDALYEQINSMKDIEDMYAHYTISGMTQEELSRVSRSRIMELAEAALPESGKTAGWSVSGNIMSMDVTGANLQDANNLTKMLEKDPIVERCIITTASRSGTYESGDVRASIIIYLRPVETGDSFSDPNAETDAAADENAEG